MSELFDNLPEIYDQWFLTSLGQVIKRFELELVLKFLEPEKADHILDAGCGSGVFTVDMLEKAASVTGLDISVPMLASALKKLSSRFNPVCGNMLKLPFYDGTFDKTLSITAIEFIKDAGIALTELARVTKPGGKIVVATLNSLSPWAEKRKGNAQKDGGIFASAIFRSPEELSGLLPLKSRCGTCIHFSDDEEFQDAISIEQSDKAKNLGTGAFLVCSWEKPKILFENKTT